MELRVDNERPLLVVEEGWSQTREVRCPPALADALRQWARVAAAVEKTGGDEATRELVATRGRRLAGRLAVATGSPVTYVDPLTGESTVYGDRTEPTPWSTGLTVSVLCALVVVALMVMLDATLAPPGEWLALVANLVLTVGLVPSVWSMKRMLVWRWVAYGVAAGLLLGWFVWLLRML